MATTTELNSTIERAVEAFNNHDVDGYVTEFTDDATFMDPANPAGLGKAEAREYMAGLIDGFPDVKVGIDRVISSDEGTALECTFHGTHDGQFMGIPPTGETVDDEFVAIVTVSDDGITSWRDYWDRMALMEQLGVEP